MNIVFQHFDSFSGAGAYAMHYAARLYNLSDGHTFHNSIIPYPYMHCVTNLTTVIYAIFRNKKPHRLRGVPFRTP